MKTKWGHQKKNHVNNGKDCTKENVYPVKPVHSVGLAMCDEYNEGPNMLAFEEAERIKHKENRIAVWVCFECHPPKIMVGSEFNGHVDDFLHFDIVHFNDKKEANLEITKRNLSKVT